MKKKLLFTCMLLTTVFCGLSFSLVQENQESLAHLNGFDPGNIMSDYVMSNKDSMAVDEIQTFLSDKMKNCTTNTLHGYTKEERAIAPCLKDYKESNKTVAQLLWQAGQDYSINPQVLIVLLQKEQGLVTDSWPRDGWWWTKTNLGAAKMECVNSAGKPIYCVNVQYRSATGYGCPDTAPCDEKYFGFNNQIRKAAELFRTVLDGGWTNYPVGNNYIQYNPDPTCGGSIVNIKNLATSALYRYTPYQPNAGAIANNPGTAPCGAYGNRNFYHFFTEWFGDTKNYVSGAIGRHYNSINGSVVLGLPTANEICNLVNKGCYQQFEKGRIYWTSATGAWKINGGIGNYWIKLGAEKSSLGYPMSNESCGLINNGCYQMFEKGRIYWTSATGAQKISGAIGKYWIKIGADNSAIGYPTSDETCNLTGGGCFRQFQNGRVYWSSATSASKIDGVIGAYWDELGADKSSLGYPASDEICELADDGCYQQFQRGRIYWSSATGPQRVVGGIGNFWIKMGADKSVNGYPTDNEICGLANSGCFQQFQKGRIYWSSATGAQRIAGGIGNYWINLGAEKSSLGYPSSVETCGLVHSGCYQQFQRGHIYWSPTTGSQKISGAIGKYWINIGAEKSSLSYPISSETCVLNKCHQQFLKGNIYWTPTNGAWSSK